MKNVRSFNFATLSCTLLALSPLALKAQIIQAPLPDLRILNVIETGNTAHITIRNTGALNATGTFMVRAFEWKNGQWFGAGYKWVNGLAVGTNMVVAITAPGIGSAYNKYVVDSNDTVYESNELNNTFLVYTP